LEDLVGSFFFRPIGRAVRDQVDGHVLVAGGVQKAVCAG